MAKPIHRTIVGERVAERLRQLKIKQKELAARMGVQPQAVNYWIHQSGIEAHRLPQLAEILGVTMSYLMGAEEGDEINYAHSITIIDRNTAKRVPLVIFGELNALDMVHDKDKYLEQGNFVTSNVPVSDDALAFKVVDHSMEPEYRSGDVVIIDPKVKYLPGDHVAAKVKSEGAVVFREFRFDGADHCILAPLHPHFRIMRFTRDEWSQDVDVIGTMVVHEKQRRIRHTS